MTGRPRVVWLLLLSVACSPCEEQEEEAEPRTAPARDTVDERDAEPYVHSARRCGECHTSIVEQWKRSAHADATGSPVYRAMLPDDAAEECAGCHDPLAAELGPDHAAMGEGVSCDACHTAREVEVQEHAATLTRDVYDNVRYGAICDAEDHYFHRVACTPFFGEAEMCAGCHLWERSLEGGERLPVFTTYREWKQGPYAELGVPCQDCHMPETYAEIAAGWDKRYDISDHGLLGREGELRRTALELGLEAEPAGERVRVVATLDNTGAGHSVPSGLPARRIVLRVRAVGEDGEELDAREKRFGRFLVDDGGDPAPFVDAVRVASDERIPPRESVKVEWTLEAPAAGTLEAEVVWQAVDPEIAERTGLEEPAEQEVLLEASERFGPDRGGRREGLPVETHVAH